MGLAEIAATSAAVAATSSRRQKIALLAACLQAHTAEDVPIAVAFLSGEVPGGSLGVGWATMRDLPPAAPDGGSMPLCDVEASLARMRAAAGPGSAAARRHEVADLFGRLTAPEHRFLLGLLSGGLRQGALGGVMVEAVAAAAGVPTTELRRALLVSGDLSALAGAVMAEGVDGLARWRLTPGRPLSPMLAQSAPDAASALARICPAGVEWKLDGVRVQVHRWAGQVAVFSRTLADVTDRLPELVAAVSALPVSAIVLDGEVIALRPGGRPRPFQETMSRFGNRTEPAQRAAVPLSTFFFDCLHVDGTDLADAPAAQRFAAMAGVLPAALVVPRVVAADAAAAETFLAEALAAGHEGVMVKSLDAPYEAGRRGAGWLKVKPAHSLDLVVLAAEWGHGRRWGWLSNLHLGARDPATGGFVMLGKTFKGMTDEMLAWQTQRLLALETHRDDLTVHVRPELVVEVAFDGVQTSTRYPGGIALRFARVKRYRTDKPPEQADTMDALRAIRERSA